MLRGLRPVLLVALLTSGGFADTTVLVRKSVTQLSQEAELIVYARVVGQSAAWNDKRTLIWTHTDLQVVECWKGVVPTKLSVMEPGGEVPPIGQRVPGMARYKVGELAVVFLKKDILGQWRTLGCAQGKLAVFNHAKGPRLKATPWTKHVITEARAGKGVLAIQPPLESFKKVVKQLAATKAEEKKAKPAPKKDRTPKKEGR